jgi:hypothetical protein
MSSSSESQASAHVGAVDVRIGDAGDIVAGALGFMMAAGLKSPCSVQRRG